MSPTNPTAAEIEALAKRLEAKAADLSDSASRAREATSYTSTKMHSGLIETAELEEASADDLRLAARLARGWIVMLMALKVIDRELNTIAEGRLEGARNDKSASEAYGFGYAADHASQIIATAMAAVEGAEVDGG